MAVRAIRQLGDEILRQTAQPVTEFNTDALRNLITDLKDTLHAFQAQHGTGRGIAAPQIGVSQRVVYLECQGKAYTLINPEFLEKSSEMFELWDSCFSYFGISFVVKRHYSVKIRYADINGETHTLQAEGELSELLQHELEHLDGVLAIDQWIPPGKVMEQGQYLKQ
ncbi:MAG: peptide deformylase [Firmicutes bacterium]|nr:peptide deformylase [Bacillota bacterium]